MMEQVRDKLIYFHYRKDNGEIFYVGLGNKQRPYVTDNRSDFWNKVVNSAGGRKVKVIHKNLTLTEANELEKKYIKQYGRRDLGLGPLVNLTDGGDGTENPSESTRMKMREAKLGLEPWNKGIEYKQVRGENNGDSKLTESQVIEIRNLYEPGNPNYTLVKLSKLYNVTEQCIHAIIQGKLWSYIPLTPEQQEKAKPKVKGEDNWISKLTDEKVRWIKIHYIKGHYTYGSKPLSRRFNLDSSTLRHAAIGKTWKHIQLNDDELKQRELHLKKNPMKGKVSGKKGSSVASSKLTEKKVLEIRKLYETGNYFYSDIANLYNVSKGTICSVIKRKTWAHI